MGSKLDTTPTGSLGLPHWQYELRGACACLETDMPLTREYRISLSNLLGRLQSALAPEQPTLPAVEEVIARDASGETVFGLRVAAYRETHSEHGDKYGHRYSEHWSTPNTRDPRVKVERLFTEDQVRALLALAHPKEPTPERACTICKATVAAFPEVMCCHCLEMPWPIKGSMISDKKKG